jgi:cell wall-associated NlpC family hydrolase
MRDTSTIPDIQPLVDAMLGTSYKEYDCWDLVRTLYQQGFGIGLARDTQLSAQQFQELWFRGDTTDVLTLVQPWDLVILANHEDLPISDHVGVVLDAQRFVHASPAVTGVALARLRTWKPRLLQLARLRELV